MLEMVNTHTHIFFEISKITNNNESGNVIGYHVVSPCTQCLESCNNGHFWMFHSNVCESVERRENKKLVFWNNLPRAELDTEFLRGNKLPHDQLCR